MTGDPTLGTGADDVDTPAFDIPVRPRRTFPYDDGVSYEGKTLFRLTPTADRDESALAGLVRTVLEAGPYRYGSFHDLPMPLWLVRDDGTGDVFRVSVRNGRVRLHVLPATRSAGLRVFYARLVEASATGWTVDCRTENPQPS